MARSIKSELYLLIKAALLGGTYTDLLDVSQSFTALEFIKYLAFWNSELLNPDTKDNYTAPAVFFEFSNSENYLINQKTEETSDIATTKDLVEFTLHLISPKNIAEKREQDYLNMIDNADIIYRRLQDLTAGGIYDLKRKRESMDINNTVLMDWQIVFTASIVNCGDTDLVDGNDPAINPSAPIEIELIMGLLNPKPQPIYIPEYQAVYDAFTIKPSDAIAAEQNTMIEGLVNSGVWAKKDVFYVFAAHTNINGEALLNWKNPGTFNATLINNPAFIAFEGFKGGSPNYISSNYIPSINGVNYTQNNCAFGHYNRFDYIGAGKYEIGAQQAGALNGTVISSKNISNLAFIRVNSSNSGAAANADAKGLYIANRLDGATQELYKNKVKIITDTSGSTGLVTLNMHILGLNNNGVAGSYSDAQLSMAFLGGGLTQLEADNLTNYFEAYMDSNGKGVIT